MEEMVAEQAAAVQTANFPPPWLQPHAGSWYQHPWGVDTGNDTDTFRQLRDWTLAQVLPGSSSPFNFSLC